MQWDASYQHEARASDSCWYEASALQTADYENGPVCLESPETPAVRTGTAAGRAFPGGVLESPGTRFVEFELVSGPEIRLLAGR